MCGIWQPTSAIYIHNVHAHRNIPSRQFTTKYIACRVEDSSVTTKLQWASADCDRTRKTYFSAFGTFESLREFWYIVKGSIHAPSRRWMWINTDQLYLCYLFKLFDYSQLSRDLLQFVVWCWLPRYEQMTRRKAVPWDAEVERWAYFITRMMRVCSTWYNLNRVGDTHCHFHRMHDTVPSMHGRPEWVRCPQYFLLMSWIWF